VVYEKDIEAATVIGKLGKDKEMQARLAQHRATMAALAKQCLKVLRCNLGRSRKLFIYAPSKPYVGSEIQSLGLSTPDLIKDQNTSVHTGLEKLLAMNPEYLIVGHYGTDDIINIWKNEYL